MCPHPGISAAIKSSKAQRAANVIVHKHILPPQRVLHKCHLGMVFASDQEAEEYHAKACAAKQVYVIGSLRNKQVPLVAQAIRAAGYNAFDDWYAAGPEADDHWKTYEEAKGSTYREALSGAAAKNVFAFDKRNIDASAAAVLVLPAGKSGHLELGYVAGTGKPTFVLFENEVDRWDVMYQFATEICIGVPELLGAIKRCV